MTRLPDASACQGWQWLRVSAQLYNTLADYERLADALVCLGV